VGVAAGSGRGAQFASWRPKKLKTFAQPSIAAPGRYVAESAAQVGADHGEPVTREPLGELPVELIPAWQVMHRHDPWYRLIRGRPGQVGVDLGPRCRRDK